MIVRPGSQALTDGGRTVTPAYTPKFFVLEEFLPPQVFTNLSETNALWKGWLLIDERILRSADQLRAKFGALIINNWHTGGEFRQRGLRVPGMSFFKPYSQHSFGRAIDCTSKSLSAHDMRQYIIAHREEFPFITRMEQGVSWLHADCANAPRITLVNP